MQRNYLADQTFTVQPLNDTFLISVANISLKLDNRERSCHRHPEMLWIYFEFHEQPLHFSRKALRLVRRDAKTQSHPEITIATRQNHKLYVTLQSRSGKLVEKDEYCVSFSKTTYGEPTEVDNVVVEFAQQVGKIREGAIKVPLFPKKLGRYCGEVNLRKQYYHPAFYYVTIEYSDNSKKKGMQILLDSQIGSFNAHSFVFAY